MRVWPMLLSFASAPAAAGVWVREPGAAYAQVSYGWTGAANQFDARGRALDLADEAFVGDTLGPVFEDASYHGSEVSAYGELGLTEVGPFRLEGWGSLPIRYVRSRWAFARGNSGDLVIDHAGLGDVSGGVRLGRVFSGGAVALTSALRIPLYDNHPAKLNQQAGNTDFYDDKVPLGQGTLDLEAGLAAGLSLGSHGWALAEAALRVRNRAYAPAVPGRVQVGVQVARPVALFADGIWQLTLPGGQQPTSFRDEWGKGPTIVDHTQRVEAGGGLLLRPFRPRGPELWKHTGLVLRGAHTVWGQRTSATTTLSAGLFLEV